MRQKGADRVGGHADGRAERGGQTGKRGRRSGQAGRGTGERVQGARHVDKWTGAGTLGGRADGGGQWVDRRIGGQADRGGRADGLADGRMSGRGRMVADEFPKG